MIAWNTRKNRLLIPQNLMKSLIGQQSVAKVVAYLKRYFLYALFKPHMICVDIIKRIPYTDRESNRRGTLRNNVVTMRS